jgi:hypothetical protein
VRRLRIKKKMASHDPFCGYDMYMIELNLLIFRICRISTLYVNLELRLFFVLFEAPVVT